MDKRGRGRPRYSRPGGRRYIHAITKTRGHGTSEMSPHLADAPPLRGNHSICRLILAVPYLGFAETRTPQSFLQLFLMKRIVDDRIRSDRCFSASFEDEKHFNGMRFVKAFRKGPYVDGQASLGGAFSP